MYLAESSGRSHLLASLLYFSKICRWQFCPVLHQRHVVRTDAHSETRDSIQHSAIYGSILGNLGPIHIYRNTSSSVQYVLSDGLPCMLPSFSIPQCPMPNAQHSSSQTNSSRHPCFHTPLSVVQRPRLVLVDRPLIQMCRELDRRWRRWRWVLDR